MKKRLIAMVLTMVLALTCFSGVNSYAKTKLEGDTMKDMVLLMKNKFGIGDEFTEFDYDYYENNDSNTWYFDWASSDDEKRISVTCDGEGHVKNYYLYDYNSIAAIPEFTKDELVDKAKSYIKKIEPDIAKHVVYKNASYISYMGGYRFSLTVSRTE